MKNKREIVYHHPERAAWRAGANAFCPTSDDYDLVVVGILRATSTVIWDDVNIAISGEISDAF